MYVIQQKKFRHLLQTGRKTLSGTMRGYPLQVMSYKTPVVWNEHKNVKNVT